MKKIFALILALMMAFTLAACGGNGTEETSTTEAANNATTEAGTEAEATTDAETEATTEATTGAETGSADAVIASALEVLEAAWAAHPEEEKTYFMGGDMNNMVNGAPGKFDLSDAESAEYTLGIPQANLAMVDDAASIMHGMNANNFTCAAYHVTDSANVQALADAIKDATMNKQWMCGFPDTLIVVSVGADYLVTAYGNAQTIETFKTNLLAAYEGNSTLIYEESLAF